MKRIFLLFFLSLATVLCAKETVKIGLILPMTGNNAFIAEDITAAVRLVENELKTRATAFDYKFIVEDDSLFCVGPSKPRQSWWRRTKWICLSLFSRREEMSLSLICKNRRA
jgi:hypothetical protein